MSKFISVARNRRPLGRAPSPLQQYLLINKLNAERGRTVVKAAVLNEYKQFRCQLLVHDNSTTVAVVQHFDKEGCNHLLFRKCDTERRFQYR